MTDALFADSGPEGRNRDSSAFERQLRGLSTSLGWRVIEENVDLYLRDHHKDAAGIDLVVAFRDPQTSRNVGWFLEGKRHDGPDRYTAATLTAEVQRLRDKVAYVAGRKQFTEHDRVRPHIDSLVGGVLAHSTNSYDRDRVLRALEGMELQHFEYGDHPLAVAFLGPDSLNGLAESFEQTGSATEFLWPLSSLHPSEWSSACPPEQLAAGMIAYRTESGSTVLWLRDTLEHGHIPALARLARMWGQDFDTVVCTELTSERMRLLRRAWEDTARDSARDSGVGRLPEDVRALELTHANMKEFNKRWPAEAA